MNHYATQWIEDWCVDNGWTDWFLERSSYWGFPPNAVMPMPIPRQALRGIKADKGLCYEEQIWCTSAIASAVFAAVLSVVSASPMPVLAAFAFSAVVVALLEEDEN
jgi:hypothetical protein